jgi:hypothetical protein
MYYHRFWMGLLITNCNIMSIKPKVGVDSVDILVQAHNFMEMFDAGALIYKNGGNMSEKELQILINLLDLSIQQANKSVAKALIEASM